MCKKRATYTKLSAFLFCKEFNEQQCNEKVSLFLMKNCPIHTCMRVSVINLELQVVSLPYPHRTEARSVFEPLHIHPRL